MGVGEDFCSLRSSFGWERCCSERLRSSFASEDIGEYDTDYHSIKDAIPV